MREGGSNVVRVVRTDPKDHAGCSQTDAGQPNPDARHDYEQVARDHEADAAAPLAEHDADDADGAASATSNGENAESLEDQMYCAALRIWPAALD